MTRILVEAQVHVDIWLEDDAVVDIDTRELEIDRVVQIKPRHTLKPMSFDHTVAVAAVHQHRYQVTNEPKDYSPA